MNGDKKLIPPLSYGLVLAFAIVLVLPCLCQLNTDGQSCYEHQIASYQYCRASTLDCRASTKPNQTQRGSAQLSSGLLCFALLSSTQLSPAQPKTPNPMYLVFLFGVSRLGHIYIYIYSLPRTSNLTSSRQKTVAGRTESRVSTSHAKRTK